MTAGRPRKVDPGALYAFAQQLYWDFRRLAEGGHRWRLDRKVFEKSVTAAESLQLTEDQKRQIRDHVESEVQAGRVKTSEKAARLREAEEAQLSASREFVRMDAAESARKVLKIPGEPDVLEALLRARTPVQVRRICKDAYTPMATQGTQGSTTVREKLNWPISLGSVLPMYLSQHAPEFIAARKDKRFPLSNRPTSRAKQLWFLSRAVAGAIFGVRTRTAMNLVGSKRPEELFEESRGGKPARKRRKHVEAPSRS